MKNFKWAIFGFLLTGLLGLGCYGCQELTGGEQTSELQQVEQHELQSSSREGLGGIAIGGSLENLQKRVDELETNIIEISDEQETISQVFSDYKKEVKSKKNSQSKLLLLSCMLGFLGVVLGILSLLRLGNYKKRLDWNEGELEELRKRKSENKDAIDGNVSAKRVNSVSSSSLPPAEVVDLLGRVKLIEGGLAELSAWVRSNQAVQISETDKMTRTEQVAAKKGYFGSAIGGERGRGYFKKLLETREDARFSAQVYGIEARFRPIVPVGAILSSDAMELAVEFSGVPKNMAVAMEIESEGEARLLDDKWVIVEKVKIILKK